MNQINKQQIVCEARALYEARKRPNFILSRTCLQHALCVIDAAKQHGRNLELRAGSLFIRYAPPTNEMPGIGGWDWERNNEYHIWAVDVIDGNAVVDITTSHLKAASTGFGDWLAPNPPDFIWGRKGIPADWKYRENQQALDSLGAVVRDY